MSKNTTFNEGLDAAADILHREAVAFEKLCAQEHPAEEFLAYRHSWLLCEQLEQRIRALSQS